MSKTKGAPAPDQPQHYTLPIDHEHAGVQHQTGDTLQLYPDQIALIERVAAVRLAGETLTD